MKDSFVFYRSFYEALRRLDNKDLKADIYDAICELALNENSIEINDNLGGIIMDLVKPQIIANNQRYSNGKKGGRPLKNHRLLEEKTIGYENEKPNVNVNDNENVNVNDNDDDIYTYIEKHFVRTLNPSEYEEISKWEDNELTRYAIKQASLNNACSIKYVISILNGYKKDNVKTVAEAEEREKRFKGNKTNLKKTNEEKIQEYLERRKNERERI